MLSCCNGKLRPKVSEDLTSDDGRAVRQLLQTVADERKWRIVLLLVNAGSEEGLQDELDKIMAEQSQAGQTGLDILVVSGKALERHLPALATRPHLFPQD